MGRDRLPARPLAGDPDHGWAVERFGARKLRFGALALFIAGSALSGAAWSAGSLIVFRIVQGFAGGVILPVGQTMFVTTLFAAMFLFPLYEQALRARSALDVALRARSGHDETPATYPGTDGKARSQTL